eukprot:symbB.v1.2.039952.t1/scaffold6883.1/size14836/1
MSSSAACAKCKRGAAAEGDSWCLGCLALENTLASLKANWWSASHRRLAEEICVQAAKQLRAVKNLDTSLQSFADSCEARLKKASASSGARRPPEPPRSRPILTEAAVVPPVVKQEEVQQEVPARSLGLSKGAESLQHPLLQLGWKIITSQKGLVTVLVGGKLPLPSIGQGAAAEKGGGIEALGLGIGVVPNIKKGHLSLLPLEIRHGSIQRRRTTKRIQHSREPPQRTTLRILQPSPQGDRKLWELGPPPVGSVVTLSMEPAESGLATAIIALLVLVTVEREDGYWLQVKFLGTDQAWARAQAVSDFSRQKKQVHICRAPLESGCHEVKGIHVQDFGVWPPGKFNGNYVEAKKMAEMKKFLEEMAPRREAPVAPPGDTTPGRLAALRQRLMAARAEGAGATKSVHFADGVPSTGILKRRALSDAVVPKREIPAQVLSSDSEGEALKPKKRAKVSRDASISAALYAAVEKRQNEGKRATASPSPEASSVKSKKKKKKKKNEKEEKLEWVLLGVHRKRQQFRWAKAPTPKTSRKKARVGAEDVDGPRSSFTVGLQPGRFDGGRGELGSQHSGKGSELFSNHGPSPAEWASKRRESSFMPCP